jgi:hypothetical protein
MKSSIALIIVLVFLVTVPAMSQSTTRYMRGTVRYSSSNKPAPLAWVIVKQGGSEKGRSLTSDDGSYFIRDLPNGLYDLVVTRGGRTLYEGRAHLPENKVFDIPLGGR